ncbi:transcriptional regulator [Vibrio lentus]|uniref:transcriptional regulator n=1 Tax=Vibrio lentus TaxID=136468 RepID=UPI000CBF0264|nr:transcriptional regulator [Vibrio lentus]PMN48394.1 transcriptional regulator [Vibrio lentus]
MINCPSCEGSYRVLTSRPVSAEIREYCCECKQCEARFRQYAAFEEFIVENKNSQPPNQQLQPVVAKRRDKMLDRLELLGLDEPKESYRPMGMVFKNAH